MSEPTAGEAVQPPAASASNATQPAAQGKGEANSVKSTDDGTSKKLSPAELKKQKAAEKQARRAQSKGSGPAPNQNGPPSKASQKQQKDLKQPTKDDKARPLPVRRRPSQSNVLAVQPSKKDAKRDSKQIGLFFGHLFNQPRQHSMVGASKDVHPAVLALGLQYSSYTICGSTARMVAMLLAFKAVIDSYQTPVGTSLARHMVNHHLGPQIDYLRSCRPISIGMGNAIRWLKDRTSALLYSLHV